LNGKGLPLLVGIMLTVVMHGALAAGYVAYRDAELSRVRAKLGETGVAKMKQAPLLCGERRCPRIERRQKRRDIEQAPVEAPEVLEAAMIPALGGVLPDPNKLPEIETYERPEVFKDGVNLDETPSKLEQLIKDSEAKEALKDPKSKDKLDKIINDSPDDPRARAKDLSRITGFKDGEVGGQGMEMRLGSTYSVKVSKELTRIFKVPPFLDEATLKKLQVRVQVTRMGFDGSIETYRVVSKSGDKSFDDAALAAIKQFVPKEGGQKRLPVPEPEVLRFINTKGLLVTLDGRLKSR
jgi:hypothetical protein